MAESELTIRLGRLRSALAAVLLLAALKPMTITAATASEGSDRTHTVEHDDTIYEQKLRVGPFNMGVGGQVNQSNVVPRPAGDFVLKHWSADVVREDGTPVAHGDVHLHHIAIARLNAEDPACPSRVVGGAYPNLKAWVILASGAERTPIELADPFGYFEPTGAWGANYHLMNTSAAPQNGVYIEYTVKYLKGLDHPELISTTPYFMDVAGHCTSADYDVPGSGIPGTTHTKTWDFTMPEDGTVLGTGGHLHYHGIATELYDGSDKLLCRSEAVYGEGGHEHSAPLGDARTSHDHGEGVDAMTSCPWVMEPVEEGEALQLRSIYHNENPVIGAMGINITMIAHNWLPPPEWFPQQITTTTTAPTTTGGQQTTTTAQQTTTSAPPTAAPIPATPTYTG
jgi:hypothetical protein